MTHTDTSQDDFGSLSESDAVQHIEEATAHGLLSAASQLNIRRWLTEPAYANYVSTLCGMIGKKQFEQLEASFWRTIPFGTGGRRGPMGELGTATVNPRTMAESAAGLAAYVKKQIPNRPLSVVVACDTRNRSKEFSKLTACVMAAAGFHVFLFDSFRSTPALSFAVRYLHCDAGVMISASHNPPSDNGFKAYWSGGAQLLSPHDQGVVECVSHVEHIPVVEFDDAREEGLIENVGSEIDTAYIDAVCSLSLSLQREVAVIFSPLHGVGETSIFRVLKQAGFENVEIFEPHRKPDGNFPNVPDQLPNPERPDVFLPIYETAQNRKADIILASDPDADRLAISVADATGEFHHQTGNQVGVILCDYILRKRKAAGTLSENDYVVETLVTTPLISKIAKSFGIRAIDNLLVGFKYIARTIDDEEPEHFLFGAEESLGYLAGDYCRDKDAAIAALYIAEAAAEMKAQGKTLLDRLDEIYSEHGYHWETQFSQVCRGADGQKKIEKILQTLRSDPPTNLAGFPVETIRDFESHEIRSMPENRFLEKLPEPHGKLIFLDSKDADFRFSLAVRPSGTEPKIKFYSFADAKISVGLPLAEVQNQTHSSLKAVETAMQHWLNGILSA